MLLIQHLIIINLKSMKTETSKDEKVMQLNETLPEFYLENLEERLETDPLTVGSLFRTELTSEGCIGDSYCGTDGKSNLYYK